MGCRVFFLNLSTFEFIWISRFSLCVNNSFSGRSFKTVQRVERVQEAGQIRTKYKTNIFQRFSTFNSLLKNAKQQNLSKEWSIIIWAKLVSVSPTSVWAQWRLERTLRIARKNLRTASSTSSWQKEETSSTLPTSTASDCRRKSLDDGWSSSLRETRSSWPQNWEAWET